MIKLKTVSNMSFIKHLFLKTITTHNLKRTPKMDKIERDLKQIFFKSLDAVNPRKLIQDSVKIQNSNLLICDKVYYLNKNCHIVGFGKAVYHMADEMEAILGKHIVDGVISVPIGTFGSCKKISNNHVSYQEGGSNNLPDAAAERTTRDIVTLVSGLKEKDLLIVLISGGGSALLPLPKPPVTLEQKSALIKCLSTRGANIIELNSVRKQLSLVKGGGLARFAYPATVISLILSDIINDPIDWIASGPTVETKDEPEVALHILEKYCPEMLSESVRKALQKPFKRLDNFNHVTNFVIGSNKMATEKAREEAEKIGYQSCVLSTGVAGDVSCISQIYANLVLKIADVINEKISKSELYLYLKEIQTSLSIPEDAIAQLLNLDYQGDICLVAGGEPTVKVLGSGKGGRNQQLALQFSIDVNAMLRNSAERVKNMNISLLCCGTDGIDGPTDAAGAIGFNELCDRADRLNIDPNLYLAQNDSYSFYNKFCEGRFLIRTGHTGTNVMDIHLLIITRNK